MAVTFEVPIIDIGPFRDSAAGTGKVVARIERACRETGFFLVTNHGVPVEVTGRLYKLARAFFDLPEADKRQVAERGTMKGGLSFAPIASEALAATLGHVTPGDYKESLNYGPRLPGGDWPLQPNGLKAAFHDYSAAMEQLAVTLRTIFCEAIGLPRDHFEGSFRNNLSALRVINYPEQDKPPMEGQLRAGVHTDYGFMTILRSEASTGGLQVQSRDGQWHDAPSIEGAYVINIGDAFMRWTNDEWVSTPHRVINPPAQDRKRTRRQSIPYFVNPDAAAVIRCLEQFQGDRGAKYDPITYGEYIAIKTKQAFNSKPAT